MTAWQFCYYDSTIIDGGEDDQYGAKFMIYRRSDPNSDRYVPVAGNIMTQLLAPDEVGSNFSCKTVAATEMFEIQENDIVGACVWHQGNVNPLYLIGDTADDNANQKLYQYNRLNYEHCTGTQIGNVDTQHPRFRQTNQWILHLHVITGIN